MAEDRSREHGSRWLAQGGLLGVLAVWAVGSVAGLIQRQEPLTCINLRSWSDHDTRYTRMAQRYLPLAEPLRGHRVVGFISGFHHDEGHRMMAQSMLAPTLVIDSAEPAVLVASFGDDGELQRFIKGSPFAVRQRFGDGVAIVERR